MSFARLWKRIQWYPFVLATWKQFHSHTSKATRRNWFFKRPCGCGWVWCNTAGLAVLTLHISSPLPGLPVIATHFSDPEKSLPLYPAGWKKFRPSSGSTPSPQILGVEGPNKLYPFVVNSTYNCHPCLVQPSILRVPWLYLWVILEDQAGKLQWIRAAQRPGLDHRGSRSCPAVAEPAPCIWGSHSLPCLPWRIWNLPLDRESCYEQTTCSVGLAKLKTYESWCDARRTFPLAEHSPHHKQWRRNLSRTLPAAIQEVGAE